MASPVEPRTASAPAGELAPGTADVAPAASPRDALADFTPGSPQVGSGGMGPAASPASPAAGPGPAAEAPTRRVPAAQVRAVARFYEGDAAGRVYWRAVLDEIERLPSR